MAKRVFFSFHYQDVVTFRANVVRNHHVTKDIGTAGFFDASIWEDAKLQGADAVKRLIRRGLDNTSVACVLIGSRTWERRWVRYEILKSYDRGNALLGIHINGVKDKNLETFTRGVNPFTCLGLYINDSGGVTYHERDGEGAKWRQSQDLPTGERAFNPSAWGRGYTMSAWVTCHDWAAENGYTNFATWLDSAT